MSSKSNTGWKARIKKELREQGRSQRSVSMAAGLGHSSLRYLLSNADTLSFDTAQALADALGISVKELLLGDKTTVNADADLGRVGVRLIGIRQPVYRPKGEPDGFVAVPEKLCPPDTYAFRMPDNSMMEFGQNMPVDPSTVVLKDDIVVWSPSKKHHPGKLAVVGDHLPEGWDGTLTVRKLAMVDEAYQAVANNVNFGRHELDTFSGIAGGVILIVREA